MMIPFHICSLVICIAIVSMSFVSVATATPRWEQVPLKTRAQHESGFAGGDGYQYVHAIAYAPSDPSRVYLTVDTSAVWRSDTGGQSWRPVISGFLAYGGRALAVDPINSDIVIVAGFLGFDKKRADKYPNKHQGIYLSDDGGKSWSFKYATDFYKQESKGELFAFMPRQDDKHATSRIFCGTYEDGLLLSENGGSSWQSVGFKGEQIIDLAAINENKVLIATTKGLYSHNGFETKRIGLGLPSWPRSIASSPATPDIVYAAVGKQGVYKSVDGGNSFALCSTGLKQANWTDIATSSVNADQVYVRSHLRSLPPYYTHDGGEKWHAPANVDRGNILGKPGFYFSSPFATHPTNPNTALHVTNGRARIVRTNDGGETWEFSGDGFTGARMTAAAWLNDGSHIFALTDHGLWHSEDNGVYDSLYVKRVFGQHSSSAIAIRDSHIIASLGQWVKKGLAVSQNNGKSWSYHDDFPGRFNFIAFSQNEKETAFAGDMISRDNGQHWNPLKYTAVAVSTNGTLYGLPADGTAKRERQIFASDDDGRSWRQVFTAPISIGQIRDFAVDPTNNARVFLATPKGLYIREGNNWIVRDDKNGLANDAFGKCYVEKIVFSPKDPKTVFVGRRSVGYGRANGVFMSKDGGLSWTNANYNLEPGLTVFGLVAAPNTGTIYMGTSLGTFRLLQ